MWMTNECSYYLSSEMKKRSVPTQKDILEKTGSAMFIK